MAVNLCAAHKKIDSRAAHKVLLACFLQSCSTRRWISCSVRNRACVLSRKITLMSRASLVQVTRQKYKNTHVLPHTSVNLKMSCTAYIYKEFCVGGSKQKKCFMRHIELLAPNSSILSSYRTGNR